MTGLKTVFDKCVSWLSLPFLIPLFALIGVLIKVTSKGPIFYMSPRVGQCGRIFYLYKFRTMYVGADKEIEGSITVKGDRRVTPIGKILRRFKIDELPSLINVLNGEMSLVGPRPDVPGYADMLDGMSRRILMLKPGITGPATLKYANEEELLAKEKDPKRYNDEVIFPDKVRINLEYMDHWSLLTDLKLIIRTIFRANY